MTKKALPFGQEDMHNRVPPDGAGSALARNALPTRTASAKLLTPPQLEEKACAPILGKFSSGALSAAQSEEPSPLPSHPSPRTLLTKKESSGALRRGTPRPKELQKTLSTVQNVLIDSGLTGIGEDEEEEEEEVASKD